MKIRFKAIMFLLTWMFLISGCIQYDQLKYRDYLAEINGDCSYKGQRGLCPNKPIYKEGVVNLLCGPDRRGIDPDIFKLSDEEQEYFLTRLQKQKEVDDIVIFRFIHLSDIQIRDRAQDFGARKSSIVDLAAETVENNFYQDHADVFYLGFLLEAIRLGLEQTSIDSVIHTGDSVHIGCHDELILFNELLGEVLINQKPCWNDNQTPCRNDNQNSCWNEDWLRHHIYLEKNTNNADKTMFFNVIGNHDVWEWGNIDIYSWFPKYRRRIYSSRNLADSLKKICGANSIKTISEGGYYCEDREMQDRTKVKFIMLNTNEIDHKCQLFNSLSPSISREQKKWLECTLKGTTEEDIVLIFGHNPLEKVTVGAKSNNKRELINLLNGYPQVRGYFCGHVHSGRLSPKLSGADFCQFVVPSIQEYPKCFSIVTLHKKYDGKITFERDFFNIEDIIPFCTRDTKKIMDEINLKAKEYAKDGLNRLWPIKMVNNQHMFTRWLKILLRNKLLDPAKRARFHAETCYMASKLDMGKRVDKKTDECAQLQKLYRSDNTSWEEIKSALSSGYIKKSHLE